ncbi:MAG: hypothetical protein AAGC70_00010 [Pseudomonadota bacterium]
MSAVDTASTPFEARSEGKRGLLGHLASLARLFVGVLLCLTPLTAVLVLGWLFRMMEHETRWASQRLRHAHPETIGSRPHLPNWIAWESAGPAPVLTRWFGALIANARRGVGAAVTIAAGTLPFTTLWLLAWWAGWNNSFNKGYEQAWVGPTLGLLGVLIALPLLSRLPMALAHQAATGRMAAFFAGHDVRHLIRAVGWRYAGLSLLFVVAALPLGILKSAPVFVEFWSPGFLERNAAEVEAFANSYQFWATAYLLLVLIWLRRASARLYARATLVVAKQAPQPKPSLLAGLVTMLQSAVHVTIWFGLIAQVFVTQFLHHQWVAWLNPPLVALPWFPPLGAAL